MQEITTIGLDLAKQVYQVHGAEADGSLVVSRKLHRGDALAFLKKFSPSLVGMETCGGSHYWAREVAKFGHDVRLVPPSYVKPFVKRGKTDTADAEAICEAVSLRQRILISTDNGGVTLRSAGLTDNPVAASGRWGREPR